MPAPSQLAISTGVLRRLTKEFKSYQTEQKQQETRISALDQKSQNGEIDEDSNEAYQLKQEKKALEETKAVFPQLKDRINTAKDRLNGLLENTEGPDEEVEKAKEVLSSAEEMAG